MVKIEAELTDEQIEKLNELESYGIGFGKLVDNFYEAREIFASEIDEIENDNSFLSKIKDNSLDINSKAENLDENFTDTEDYDVRIKDARHKISWAKDIFGII
ncbi:hypothetical protein [uncultured Methanobrevibacter sp.]|uniref:hypothetical protein n=1 Tax=uncultured Methanobrevibacter sp. TaxID=253161 RepID=UPI0025CE2C0A|nr:hypothetical protein [uncultured Methanobrevibacter sp.]